MIDKKNIKRVLFEVCQKKIEHKINSAKQGMDELQEASDNETKSSAGDKYETGREMLQMERDKYLSQLTEALKLQKLLAQIPPDKESPVIGLGSLVYTNNGVYFLSLPLGKIDVEGEDYYLISTASPVGRLLTNRKAGESFAFNGKKYDIMEIG